MNPFPWAMCVLTELLHRILWQGSTHIRRPNGTGDPGDPFTVEQMDRRIRVILMRLADIPIERVSQGSGTLANQPNSRILMAWGLVKGGTTKVTVGMVKTARRILEEQGEV